MGNTKLAVIGGSKAYDMLAKGSFGECVKGDASKTPYGDSAPLHLFEGEKLSFYFLSRHGEDGYSVSAPFVNYRANIWALKEKGVERIVAWSGPGAINAKIKPGDFAVPHDVIDNTKNRPSTFFAGTGMGFIRMSEPFCPELRGELLKSVGSAGATKHDKAVYICTEGPRLETSAEIKMFSQLGADLVGMTLVPELFLAREMEICYAPICYVTNFAEGVVERSFKEGELFEGMQSKEERQAVEKSLGLMPAIVRGTLEGILNKGRDCACRLAMARYKKSGQIKDLLHDVSK